MIDVQAMPHLADIPRVQAGIRPDAEAFWFEGETTSFGELETRSTQVANGLILPILAVFLLVAMNRRDLLGKHVNSGLANLLGGLVVLITFGLGLRLILRALNVWV